MAEEKRKRRFGDRKGGHRLRTLDAYNAFTPYIMKQRNDASNLFKDSVELTETDKFILKKRNEGLKGLGLLHIFVASYVRMVSQRPALNRFIAGRFIYSRNNIEIVMTVKKAMTTEASETSIKVIFEPTDTITDVYYKMNEQIEKVKSGEEESNTDNVANALMRIPRLILQFAVWIIEILDYFGILPQSLLNASPFHGTMVITDMGSLGIPTIHHHLYNFGDLPVFLAFGAKRKAYEVQKDGTVAEKKYVDYTATIDERICDGYYFATAFRYMRSYLKNPEQLDVPPDKVFEDLA
ncbi:MAG: 2-oxo acid dehydrogenase subunit E2 [Oscillospiraceae bacterium]